MDEYAGPPYHRQAIFIAPDFDDELECALYHIRAYYAVVERSDAVRLILANKTPAELATIAAVLLSKA